MMRKQFVAALLAMTVLAASAVPAKRQTRVVTQPDGTTVTLTIQGDEWFHSYVTSDGLAVGVTSDGRAVYRTDSGLTDILVHEAAERSAGELRFLASPDRTVRYDAVREASPRLAEARATAMLRPQAKIVRKGRAVSVEQGESQVPHKGVANVPIILVQYTDVQFRDGQDAKETFEDFFHGEAGSARKYFQDASLGQYDPQFHIFGPYTLPNKRAYYGGNGWSGDDVNVRQMVSDAIDAADSEADFSIFDNDGDGLCDVVIVLYAGVGEASASDVSEAVWPCQWQLSSPKRCDGVRLSKFAVFNELNGSHRTQIDGVGTFCHEFSHCLGLPDFYDTKYSGHFGMSSWSLMDYGSYNNDGYTPIGYSAYEKAFMGWLDLTEGERATAYTLPVLNNQDAPEKTAVVIPNSRDNNEYFIFENRARQGWDAYIEDDGMMITHVTYSASAWDSNVVNNYSLQRMTIVPADNSLSDYNLDSDLWPKTFATEFTDESVPAARVNTGSFLSRPVTEITRDPSTGAVSFWLDKPEKPTVETPVAPVASAGDEPGSFVAAWAPVETGGIDITYTLQVWPKNMAVPLPSLWQDFTADDGLTWKSSGSVMKRSMGIVLGSATQEGAVTSADVVYADNGNITVAARAVRYGTDADIVSLVFTVLDESGKEVAQTECDVDRNKGYRSCLFSGLTSGKAYKVRIGNRGQKMRVTVENALVFTGDYAQAEDSFYDAALDKAREESSLAAARTPEVSVSGERITVAGIPETSFTVTGLTPGETYVYRVKAVPVHTEDAFESYWSANSEVDLSTLGIPATGADASAASFLLSGGELIARPGARLYSVSGAEIPAVADGRFRPAPGAYIVVAPGLRPAKVIIR